MVLGGGLPYIYIYICTGIYVYIYIYIYIYLTRYMVSLIVVDEKAGGLSRSDNCRTRNLDCHQGSFTILGKFVAEPAEISKDECFGHLLSLFANETSRPGHSRSKRPLGTGFRLGMAWLGESQAMPSYFLEWCIQGVSARALKCPALPSARSLQIVH